MSSEDVLRVIAVATTYKRRPSEIMDICDPYLAYCFDEALMYIKSQIQDKKKPNFARFRSQEENDNIAKSRTVENKTFSAFVKKIGVANAPQIIDKTKS